MITIQNVHKRFGPLVALDGVSLRIEAGERVAMVGSNGSGKTTLLRALCGLLRVDGEITIDGVRVREHPERALRALAYMPQVTPPLAAPVAELVRAYVELRGMSGERVRHCAVALGLELDAIARSRVRDLSGGTKQKLLASLALSAEAPILVCDEPTASMDEAARAAFFELVEQRPRGSTLILCGHRLEEMYDFVHRVVELRDGKLHSDESMGDITCPAAPRARELRRAG